MMDIDEKDGSDFLAICEEKIPIAREMAKIENDFRKAIEILLQLEKQTRMAGDMISTSRILTAIVQICFEQSKWDAMNEYILVLAHKRSQFKESIKKMVQDCALYLEKVPDEGTKLKLIETLLKVTEGKIYIEVERARLTKKLSKIKEDAGDIDAATTLMTQLKVETYGTMQREETMELILEQVRLLILKADFEKAQILAKKVSTKFLEEAERQDLKLKFYELKITMDKDSDFLGTSRHYQAMSECSIIDDTKKQDLFVHAVIYCILSPYDIEQQDMMQNLLRNRKIDVTPMFKNILNLFICNELISQEGFIEEFGVDLLKVDIFNKTEPHGRKCWEELKSRITEHNIRVISCYYTRITMDRMSELLHITKTKCEEYLMKLVNSGVLSTKIDRPLEIVHFNAKLESSDMLTVWSNRVDKLMKLVNNTAHLVNKEQCLKDA